VLGSSALEQADLGKDFRKTADKASFLRLYLRRQLRQPTGQWQDAQKSSYDTAEQNSS